MRKESKLNAIQKDAQRVAEAISSSLELETEIVDETLTIVAGTGRYRDMIGLKEEGGNPQAGYIYGRVVTRGKAEIVEDAPNDPKYDPSVHHGTTAELAEICCPIIAQGQVLGVIGLVAFSDTQLDLLLERKNQLVDFVHRMAELLASKAVETETLQNITVVSNQLRTIIDSIDNGILAVDNRGTIMHCNQIGASLIGRSRRTIIGKRISKIWAGSPILNVLNGSGGYDWREESYQAANHTMHFMVTVNPVVLESKIVGAVASFRDMAEVRKKAYDMIVTVQPVGVDDIWGESPQIRELRKTILQVAQSNANVLITGETGTGKGLVASAIHHSGPRLAGPFISVNCGAIPDSLIESELFGYSEGAFSGARKGGKPGKFELADSGSISLDEIGDLPLRLQPKLLHVIQSRIVERLGGVKSIPVNARVIASTNRNRLNVIPLHIPPLRVRKDDILILLDRFLEKYCRSEGKVIKGVSTDVQDLFLSYSWPGNVRELENTAEYMAGMASGEIITMDGVPSRIKRKRPDMVAPDMSLDALLQRYEEELLRQKLAEIGDSPGRKEKLAEMLQVSRATLYRKMKKLGIQ
jgi:transcriptional regulator with PAS, ATPase and Fis domain